MIPSPPSSHTAMLSSFDELDRDFASFLSRLAQCDSPHLALAAAMVSQVTRAGHVCLDLGNPPILDQDTPVAPRLSTPSIDEWRSSLAGTSVVGNPGEFKPLILDSNGRLYLQRYWHYETLVAQGIAARLPHESDPRLPAQTGQLSTILDRYFSQAPQSEPDQQRLAVQTALTRRFAVITGGPGTGKTYTIAVLLAAFLEYHAGSAPRIALTAPTGKAAVRLQEAVQAAREKIPAPPDVVGRMPVLASTLHRLLHAVPGTSKLLYGPDRPLPFDLIIIDEASMVDLALMARLSAACSPATHLILVGDMNQLASVEAGAVLGDICDGLRPGTPEPQAHSSPLATCVVELRRNYRFGEGDAIAAFSNAINTGDAPAALQSLKSNQSGALHLATVPPPAQLADRLRARVASHFESVVKATDPAEALARLSSFRVLCALRRGPTGSEALNRCIEKLLADLGLIRSPTPFYAGRPILILKNDYHLRLFNGDIGVILPHPDRPDLRAWFLDARGQLRDFAIGRLPEHETVFAMTVHKSQGSEFQDVLLVLPEQDSPVLSRELIYTGATRARRSVEVWLEEKTFQLGLARRTRRTSGLADRLRRGAGKIQDGNPSAV